MAASIDLESLRDKLTQYGDQYLSGDLDVQRLAVTNALLALAEYLEGQGFPPQARLPVMRPAQALAERELNNALDIMFTQRRRGEGPNRGGRPRRTFDEQMRAGILAALADFWLRQHEEDDQTQPEKLKEAARRMRGPWFRQVSGSTLKSAREIISTGASDEVAVEFYQSFSQFIDQTAASVGPRRAFPYLVRYINEHPVSTRMGILKTLSVSPLDPE